MSARETWTKSAKEVDLVRLVKAWSESGDAECEQARGFLAALSALERPVTKTYTVGEVLTPNEIRAVRAAFRARVPVASGSARAVPPVIEDSEECDGFKPDPAAARTRDELRTMLRDFWEWVGSYGCRRVAAGSGGAFSHATAAKLIAADPRVPLKLEYVRGFIAGCGGNEAEQRRWVSAYRRIVQQTREQQARPHLRAVPGQRATGA